MALKLKLRPTTKIDPIIVPKERVTKSGLKIPEEKDGPDGLKDSEVKIGLTGSRGLTGRTGSKGIQGKTGEAGLSGVTGERGETGKKGSPGSTGYIFKGYLLGAYRSIVANAKAHKITRTMLITYLLLLVIAPPTLIFGSFIAAPAQTAKFFNFQVTPSIILTQYNASQGYEGADGSVLAESTSNTLSNPVTAYVGTILGPQAQAIVRFLRAILPTQVSGIILPTEIGQEPLTSAGRAMIKQGADEVTIHFKKEYLNLPVVNVNINLVGDINPGEVPLFAVYDVTIKGFKIKLNQTAGSDLSFSWIALAVESGNFTTTSRTPSPESSSGESTQSITTEDIGTPSAINP